MALDFTPGTPTNSLSEKLAFRDQNQPQARIEPDNRAILPRSEAIQACCWVEMRKLQHFIEPRTGLTGYVSARPPNPTTQPDHPTRPPNLLLSPITNPMTAPITNPIAASIADPITDMTHRPKIIVIDDDPTGSQTVHGCLLLMRWDVETLRLGLEDASPICFILANTRSMTPAEADATTREVCRNLKQVIAQIPIRDFLVVSRSDSTLRGHYPTETDAIAEELGPFDAHFMTPAFFEGGRITRDSTHYLMVDGVATPVHETEFANDSVFGFSTAYLPDYVAEKTGGRISADRVERFCLDEIRSGCRDRLTNLSANVCVAVDAECQADLDRFAADLLAVAATGKRFLFRSAASLLTSLAAVGKQPIAAEAMSQLVRAGKPGAIIVGSHVQKTTQQLQALLQEPGIVGVELDVVRLRDGVSSSVLCEEALAVVRSAHVEGKTPVVYTSRGELQFADIAARLAFGVAVSSLLMDIVRGLPTSIGFLVSKGGITSNDVLSDGLALRSARLLGQILAGCSVVTTPVDHPLFPRLPVVLFPGNVGGVDGLATVYRRFMGEL